MSALVQEWLNLLVRWVHVIAAIMWIGDSFLFMWLDSHLTAPSRPREGAVTGELWMAHSGGFYEVVKRKSLAKDELPATLHWFKWESYTTWLSGFLLLIIVFQLNGAALLIDPNVMPLQGWQAAAISLGVLPVAYFLYEMLWLTPLSEHPRAFGVVGLGFIGGLAYGLTHLFSARGAFLQVGATLGTIMAANVFFRIIPAQKHMLAATRAGQPVDTSHGLRAKGRSIQNHYLTLPVLFAMLSNHFPSTYGSTYPWLVLCLLFVFGVGLKYLMNKRRETPPAALVGTLAALIAVGILTRPPKVVDQALMAYQDKPKVTFKTVEAIVQTRCVTCHSPHPTNPMFAAPPVGVTLDTPEGIASHADRMFIRAVTTRTMPLGNLTGMTDDERAMLGAWYAQGADIHVKGPSQLQLAPAPAMPVVAATQPAAGGNAQTGGTPAEGPGAQAAAEGKGPLTAKLASVDPKAKAYFSTVCAQCHGPDGNGNGPASAVLNPKPRDFTDSHWQQSVSDEQIKKTILEGGPSVGKSPLMPPNPTLKTEPATVQGLVTIVRSFSQR